MVKVSDQAKVGHWFTLTHEDGTTPMLDRDTGLPKWAWCDDPECLQNKAKMSNSRYTPTTATTKEEPPVSKSYRTGIVRNMDQLGRVVLAKDFCRMSGIVPETPLMQTLIVDANTGRVRGLLLEPVAWIAGAQEGPTYNEAIARTLHVTATGPDMAD